MEYLSGYASHFIRLLGKGVSKGKISDMNMVLNLCYIGLSCPKDLITSGFFEYDPQAFHKDWFFGTTDNFLC